MMVVVVVCVCVFVDWPLDSLHYLKQDDHTHAPSPTAGAS